jgi:hypothetical protein
VSDRSQWRLPSLRVLTWDLSWDWGHEASIDYSKVDDDTLIDQAGRQILHSLEARTIYRHVQTLMNDPLRKFILFFVVEVGEKRQDFGCYSEWTHMVRKSQLSF